MWSDGLKLNSLGSTMSGEHRALLGIWHLAFGMVVARETFPFLALEIIHHQ